ncbi:bifunctional diaminohydroxyphosphoribosylaminopyrimidine deaminase/5-amino-6-(5-phosphoribosylamino)uracil reductase RibD [Mucilaginibacter sp. FT3.2]|uniref:bifunctional diaminohydroxyphosphoribosylaminopyrimidine deaminase/5-amino-6-(5-phosphoribosylamino)uracil reductase RibD n=1 Tax=Mucilaginibacter sp. FT3.2 TaxID=2723090 RepID=UPI0016159553|nr:bifunctional diaminohydroxyphosphoribosylaminopyrimidine deaminase/5-amino-6-(5-phosphoribosylamino)uracil reductase RibD [Mucilaginibacter sp. FT3.2]MBB6234765.1 diaminohydroxyphosphoribosylaminopyrimidine deaminase/5-amino-6-(5-phosphoribosylamino)uracil reductase [Mucilaginibacter sp. FT3.2]
MVQHEKFMRRCLELAEMGAGMVSPNPMVGAVVVHDGNIIGEGYHQKYGEAHAEVNAIAQVTARFDNAAELLKQSIIYVSLEPCAHYGKTPPCADLIVKHQIPLVVVGTRDPFAQVDGKGIEKLQAAGIEVVTGVLEAECQWLNRRFFTKVQKHRPYIILKWAQTNDGFFAPDDGSQLWITGTQSRKLVHKWRSEEDAVLVGKNTVAIDNPQLNVRYWEGRSPRRVVIDRRLELNKNLNVFDQSVETLVFNEVEFNVDGKNKYIALEDFERYVPQYILYQLYLQDIQSVIIEGGVHTLQTFIDAGLWDEARIFTGKTVLTKGIKSPQITGILATALFIENDRLQTLYNKPII